MIQLYLCLGCLEIFASEEAAKAHRKTCMQYFLVLTLDEYLTN